MILLIVLTLLSTSKEIVNNNIAYTVHRTACRKITPVENASKEAPTTLPAMSG
jgi:hypothetical protein